MNAGFYHQRKYNPQIKKAFSDSLNAFKGEVALFFKTW